MKKTKGELWKYKKCTNGIIGGIGLFIVGLFLIIKIELNTTTIIITMALTLMGYMIGHNTDEEKYRFWMKEEESEE